MLTSIEIATLLKKQQQRKQSKKGFDDALVGLGTALKSAKKKLSPTSR